MNEFRNPDGSINGVKVLSSFYGASEEEITWCAARVKELMAQGVEKAEVLHMITDEARVKPWQKP